MLKLSKQIKLEKNRIFIFLTFCISLAFSFGLVISSEAIGNPKCVGPLWIWPVQPKMIIRDFDPPIIKYLAGHRGVDLLTTAGAPILAPEDGVISFSGEVALKPVVTVRINGLKSTFEPAVTLFPVGTPVKKGMPIGTVVSPDTYINHCEPQTCVHWGIKNDAGDYFDPKDYADEKGPIVVLEMRGV
ncbi:MAG: M23 family metallopeptidase [Bifidobacteriaceae bacterium]|nr:M23 family metallopeptidase [Bifidobacteriaceae bacterium]